MAQLTTRNADLDGVVVAVRIETDAVVQESAKLQSELALVRADSELLTTSLSSAK